MHSIKANILLNGINTVTGILFPVITFPYAARVLMPEGIGAINFLNSIIGYIVLLTSLGIPLYAVKEVAKYRDNKVERDKITLEIIILSSILCLFGYVFVWILAEFIPTIHQQASIFYILSLSIIFTSIGVNWFYQAIEDFKFITIRAILFRILSALALFFFVKDASDLTIYAWIIVGSTVGNNIINFIHLRKHLNKIKFQQLRIKRHIAPSVKVFILNLIISLYIQLNTIMLGFLAGDEQVGLFTAGTKISHIGLTIISSLGTVLLPRVSNLIEKGDSEGFKNIIIKSLNITLALSMPMTAGLMLLATPITIVFCGSDYLGSVPVLLLNAPVVIFISLTNVMGIQVLYPKNKINVVIWSVTGGALTNIFLNVILIPHHGAIGAAISTLIAEFVVLLLQVIMGKSYFPFKLKLLFNLKYFIATILMSCGVYLSIHLTKPMYLQLIVGISIGVILYLISLVSLKDPLASEMILMIKNKIRLKKPL